MTESEFLFCSKSITKVMLDFMKGIKKHKLKWLPNVWPVLALLLNKFGCNLELFFSPKLTNHVFQLYIKGAFTQLIQ